MHTRKIMIHNSQAVPEVEFHRDQPFLHSKHLDTDMVLKPTQGKPIDMRR
jgi:hypothetical protein